MSEIKFTQSEIQRAASQIIEREVLQNVNETMERIQNENVDDYLDVFSARDKKSELRDDFNNGHHVDEFIDYLNDSGDLEAMLDYVEGAVKLEPSSVNVGDKLKYVDSSSFTVVLDSGEVTGVDLENETIEIDGTEYDLSDVTLLNDTKITIDSEKAIEYLENQDNGIDDFCEKVGIEGYQAEIYEHWSVTSYMADQLRDAGELVGEFEGMEVWGRQTTGQSIALDDVFQKFAIKKLEHDYELSIEQAGRGNASIKGIVDAVREDGFDLKIGKIIMPVPYKYTTRDNLIELDKVEVEVHGNHIQVNKLERDQKVEVGR